MGYYIDRTPTKTLAAHGKAVALKDECDADLVLEPDYDDVPEGKVLIVIIENGPFEAAAIIHNRREFDGFTNDGTNRPRTWMVMDRELAFKLCGRPDPEEKA